MRVCVGLAELPCLAGNRENRAPFKGRCIERARGCRIAGDGVPVRALRVGHWGATGGAELPVAPCGRAELPSGTGEPLGARGGGVPRSSLRPCGGASGMGLSRGCQESLQGVLKPDGTQNRKESAELGCTCGETGGETGKQAYGFVTATVGIRANGRVFLKPQCFRGVRVVGGFFRFYSKPTGNRANLAKCARTLLFSGLDSMPMDSHRIQSAADCHTGKTARFPSGYGRLAQKGLVFQRNKRKPAFCGELRPIAAHCGLWHAR